MVTRSDEPRSVVEHLMVRQAGQYLVQLLPHMATWLPPLPIIDALDLAQRRIPGATAAEWLRGEGYQPVTDALAALTCKFLGGAVVWEADDGTTVWARHELRALAAANPVILGFPPPRGGLLHEAAAVQMASWHLPPSHYGTLGLVRGHAVVELDWLTRDAYALHGRLQDISRYLANAYQWQHYQMLPRFWTVFVRCQIALIKQYVAAEQVGIVDEAHRAQRRAVRRRREVPHGH
ncbi:MAG: hypothetical protein H0X24_03385 [Ktedonobacterales bacterium]|nr:hypothetical protein [Ktedonobacterales bacterium]